MAQLIEIEKEMEYILGQLQLFEQEYDMSSRDFYNRWLLGRLPDTHANNFWAAYCSALETLRKAEACPNCGGWLE